MNFAPYQDTAPESTRELSPPPPPPPRRSLIPNPKNGPDSKSRTVISPPPFKQSAYTAAASTLPPPSHFTDDDYDDDDESPQHLAAAAAAAARPRPFEAPPDVENNGGGGRLHVNLFETSLPMRLDYEAVVAYLLLPPAGGVLLLLMEHKSDYVRFHAWQSSLLFTFIFVIHLIFSWSAFMSWTLLVIDIAAIALLSLHAYRDADTLDRFEVPFFGGLASSFVDSE